MFSILLEGTLRLKTLNLIYEGENIGLISLFAWLVKDIGLYDNYVICTKLN